MSINIITRKIYIFLVNIFFGVNISIFFWSWRSPCWAVFSREEGKEGSSWNPDPILINRIKVKSDAPLTCIFISFHFILILSLPPISEIRIREWERLEFWKRKMTKSDIELVGLCIEAACESRESVDKWRMQRRSLDRLPSPLADALLRRLISRRLLHPSLLEWVVHTLSTHTHTHTCLLFCLQFSFSVS